MDRVCIKIAHPQQLIIILLEDSANAHDEQRLDQFDFIEKLIMYSCIAICMNFIYVNTQHQLAYMYDILYCFILH